MKPVKHILTAAALIIASAVFFTAGCAGNSTDEFAGQVMKTDTCERGLYKLEISYPEGPLEYGSTVEIILRIEYPEEEKYILLPPDPDNAERFSNTGITGIEEGRPVPDGKGRAVSTVVFQVEAWLPGMIVFPPLTVSFPTELTTEEIEIAVDSVFDEETPHELTEIYLPEAESDSLIRIIIIVVAAVVFLSAAVALLVRYKRKRTSVPAVPQKSREEMVEEFRRRYIDTDSVIDLRKAYTEIERLIGADAASGYREYIDRARFSGDGIDYNEGHRMLLQIFGRTLTEASDAF